MTIPTIQGYAPLVQIAESGSSVVYSTVELSSDRQVAVKIVKSARLTDNERLAFARELTAMSRLADHPHVVDLIGTGFVDGRPYLVMPFYRNGNYASFVEAAGPLAWDEILDFGVKIAAALETAHSRGFIHRDIKPSNIYRGAFPRHPLLADFGVASFVVTGLDGGPTVAVAGTPIFSAPEVLNGARPTVASDLYSLGATLFGLLEGRPAYASTTLEQVVSRIVSAEPPPLAQREAPEELKALIAALMAKEPGNRPASALDVIRRLNAIQRVCGLDVTPAVLADDDAPPTPVPLPTGPVAPTSAVAPAPPVVPTPAWSDSDGSDDRAGSDGFSGLDGQVTRDVAPADRQPEPTDEEPPMPLSPPITPPTRRWRRPAVVAVGALGAASVLIAAVVVTVGRTDGGGQPDPVGAERADSAGPGQPRWFDEAEVVASWKGHDDVAGAVAWASDGETLATGGRDRSVKLWRIADPGQPIIVLESDAWVLDLAWSPDGGGDLAAAGADGTLTVWALGDRPGDITDDTDNTDNTDDTDNTGASVRVGAHEGTVEAVAWEPGGRRLASGGRDGLVRLWTPGDAGIAPEGQPLDGHRATVLSLDWTSEPTRLASAGQDGTVRLWSADGTPGAVLDHDDWVRSVAWSPRGRWLVSASADGTARLWDPATGRSHGSFPVGADPVGPLDWAPGGDVVAFGGDDGGVRIWTVPPTEPANGEPADTEPGDTEPADDEPGNDEPGNEGAPAITVLGSARSSTSPVVALDWSPEGTTLAVGRADGTIELWAADAN